MRELGELFKELEQQIIALEQSEEEASEIIAELKHENEELKVCFTSTDINAKKIQTKLFDKEEECKNYKQALEEIKEITKKYDAEAGDTIIANPIQYCYDVFIKANEVLNENNI